MFSTLRESREKSRNSSGNLSLATFRESLIIWSAVAGTRVDKTIDRCWLFAPNRRVFCRIRMSAAATLGRWRHRWCRRRLPTQRTGLTRSFNTLKTCPLLGRLDSRPCNRNYRLMDKAAGMRPLREGAGGGQTTELTLLARRSACIRKVVAVERGHRRLREYDCAQPTRNASPLISFREQPTVPSSISSGTT